MLSVASERGIGIGVGVAIDASVRAGAVGSDILALEASALLARRVGRELTNLVREEVPQKRGIDAVCLPDLVTQQVVAAAGPHFDPTVGGDIGKGVRQRDAIIRWHLVTLHASLTLQRLGIAQDFAVEDGEAEVAAPC